MRNNYYGWGIGFIILVFMIVLLLLTHVIHFSAAAG